MTHLAIDLAVAHVKRAAVRALYKLVSSLCAPYLRLRRQDATFVMQWCCILHTTDTSVGRGCPNL